MIAEDPVILHLHCLSCGRPMARRADELGAPFCSVACEAQDREVRAAQLSGLEVRERLRRAGVLYRLKHGRRKDDLLRRAIEAIEEAGQRVIEAALLGFEEGGNGR